MALMREFFFFSSRRRHTRFDCDWSSDVCSSDLPETLKRLRELGEQLDGGKAVNRHRRHHQDRPLAGTRLIREWQGVEHCATVRDDRSEERRVGKEGRSRWAPYHGQKEGAKTL